MADKTSPRGARGQAVGIRDRLRSYRLHHRATLRATMEKLLLEPWQTLMTITVIAIALALPSALFVAVENLDQFGASFDASAQISVFLSRDADAGAIQALSEKLNAMPEIASVTYVSREQALAEFSDYSGFGATLQSLEENPLPAVYLVAPAASINVDMQEAHALVQSIRQLAAVDDVQLDMRWLQRLNTLLEVSRKLVAALAVALGLGVILVIGNTIRLAIESRRDEIIVVKLVGGTNAYVRRPFLYTGLLYGLFGALFAWIMVQSCMLWVGASAARLAALYHSQLRLAGLGLDGFALLLLAGGSLGLLGAWSAVGKHLRNIEPR